MSIKETIEALRAEFYSASDDRTELEREHAGVFGRERRTRRDVLLEALTPEIAALEAVAGTVGDVSADNDRAWEALPKDMAHEICEERGYGVRGNLPAGVRLVVARLREAQQERDAAQEKADSWERWAHEKAPELEALLKEIAILRSAIECGDAVRAELRDMHRAQIDEALGALPTDIRIAADGDLVAGVKGLEAAYQVERKAVADHARELAEMRQVSAELRARLEAAEAEIRSLRTHDRADLL